MVHNYGHWGLDRSNARLSVTEKDLVELKSQQMLGEISWIGLSKKQRDKRQGRAKDPQYVAPKLMAKAVFGKPV
jgi:hypothetical protein